MTLGMSWWQKQVISSSIFQDDPKFPGGGRGYRGRAFNLHNSANRACLIPNKDFFIITGDQFDAHVDRLKMTKCTMP